jgi:hypothetical protein
MFQSFSVHTTLSHYPFFPSPIQSLKAALLVLGYTSTVLSVAAALGLVVLAQQINPEDKSD